MRLICLPSADDLINFESLSATPQDSQDVLLEQQRDRLLTVRAILIQRVVRGFLERSRFLRKKKGAVQIQKIWRGYCERRRYHQVSLARLRRLSFSVLSGMHVLSKNKLLTVYFTSKHGEWLLDLPKKKLVRDVVQWSSCESRQVQEGKTVVVSSLNEKPHGRLPGLALHVGFRFATATKCQVTKLITHWSHRKSAN